MTSPSIRPEKIEAPAWRYSINYGPEGEANYANVYSASGDFIGNLRTHHATAIVDGMNALESLKAENDGLREALRPFADFAEMLRDETPDNIALGIMSGAAVVFTNKTNVGHLRAARAFLTAQEESDNG